MNKTNFMLHHRLRLLSVCRRSVTACYRILIFRFTAQRSLCETVIIGELPQFSGNLHFVMEQG